MCRPSCCNNSGGQETGVAAVALLIGAALAAAKIGPIVAHIIHVVLNLIRLVALTTGLVVALAMLTWTAIVLTRWQLRRRAHAAARNPAGHHPHRPVCGRAIQWPSRLPGLRRHRHGAAGHRHWPVSAGRMPGV